MKSLVFVGIALLVLGCASTMSYKEPTQGDRARVRFATNTEDVAVLRSYDDASCTVNESEWMRLRVGPLVASAPKRMGMPLWNHHENAAKEVYVSSARPYTFLFSGSVRQGLTARLCGVPLTYTFEANKDYQVDYIQTGQSCAAVVSELAGVGDAGSKAALRTYDNRVTPGNAGCLEQFRKARWQ